MRYTKFVIHEYRGISEPIEIRLDNSIVPLIGVNECGKTTILEAIFSFDSLNDRLHNGRQLKDVENLYSFEPSNPRISGHLLVNKEEMEPILDKLDGRLDFIELWQKVFGSSDPDLSPDDEQLIKLDLEETAQLLRGLEGGISEEQIEGVISNINVARLRQEISQKDDDFTLCVTRHLRTLKYSVELEGVT